MRKLIILLSLAITTIACNKEDNKNYDSQNEADIKKYLVENNIDAEQTESGLYYVIDKKGDGHELNNRSKVIVSYKLDLLNGKHIGETDEYGHAFDLVGGIIPGFSEGVQLFNEGGEGTLIIPSRLAYGNHSVGNIPAGSVLVFDIKILSTEESIDSINNDQIKKYLKENDLKADSSETGLYYIIDKEGTGKKPDENSNVQVKYKGYYLNGDVFDETKGGEGATFPLRNLIPGFKEGMLNFKEGGSGTLFIPSKLGYGFFGRQPIPPGAVIIFDVELVKVY